MSVDLEKARRALVLVQVAAALLEEADPDAEMSWAERAMQTVVEDLEVDIMRQADLVEDGGE